MKPNFSVSVRFGSGSRFFRFGFQFLVFRAQGDQWPQQCGSLFSDGTRGVPWPTSQAHTHGGVRKREVNKIFGCVGPSKCSKLFL